LFDGKGWKLLEENVDPKYAKDAVLAVINKCDKKATNSLNKPGNDGRTLLHTILTAKSQSAMTKRRDLFRWLMERYPELYNEEDESGMTVLSWAIQRANRKPQESDKKGIKEEVLSGQQPEPRRVNEKPLLRQKDIQQANLYFVNFFAGEFPAETSKLLRKEPGLVHQLLPMIKGNDNCLKLLRHLDRDTVMLKDDKEGNTVLHRAVEYEYMCNEKSVSKERMKELIGVMLNNCKCPDELKGKNDCKCPDPLKETNKKSLSPYQHRVATFQECDDKKLDKKQEDCRKVPLQDDPVAMLLKDKYMHLDNRDETIKYLHGDSQGKCSRDSCPDQSQELNFILQNTKSTSISPRFQLQTSQLLKTT
jgi:hypothetical protein